MASLLWHDERAPAILFLAFTAICVPLFAFSYDLFAGAESSGPQWLLIIPLLLWVQLAMVLVKALEGDRQLTTAMLIGARLAPPLIAMAMLALLGRMFRRVRDDAVLPPADGT